VDEGTTTSVLRVRAEKRRRVRPLLSSRAIPQPPRPLAPRASTLSAVLRGLFGAVAALYVERLTRAPPSERVALSCAAFRDAIAAIANVC
jgi:hypothetical protein